MGVMGYRERIYAVFVSTCEGEEIVFSPKAYQSCARAYRHYLRGWLPQSKSAAIADLACGSGRLLFLLKEMGYGNLTGVDISPRQVQLARQILPEVVEGDVMDFLVRHPGSFDLLLAIDLFEHFYKDEALSFLDQSYKALKPGGRIILQMPNCESPLVGGTQWHITHEIAMTPGCLRSLMQLCGFQDLQFREQGPVPLGYSLFSTLRAIGWRGLRAGIRLCNLIETGHPGSGVHTRVFLASGLR